MYFDTDSLHRVIWPDFLTWYKLTNIAIIIDGSKCVSVALQVYLEIQIQPLANFRPRVEVKLLFRPGLKPPGLSPSLVHTC